MRLVAIHAHLYQPPRENPWSESIEPQPTAAPLHDWNERISSECYERLGSAPVRGPRGRIERLLNLYGRLTFDIGPTLASWLARQRPAVLQDAAEGDRSARARQSGAGAALMQPYGHPILPLCSDRERELQLEWGRADFVARFGREPVGAWLPECAVDDATLDDCARLGLRFTVLAPEQIDAVRPIDGGDWRQIEKNEPPTDRPFLIRTAAGSGISAFVFHGDLSRRLAFGGLVDSAPAARDEIRNAAQRLPEAGGVVLLAADGETFGHHQELADERLAKLVTLLDADEDIELVTLEAAFDRLAPTHEARLKVPSAWSCPHGVGRWERDCGCASEPRPKSWSFAWRDGLRRAVRGLVDSAISLHDGHGATSLRDPWDAARRLGGVLASEQPVAALDALLDAALPAKATAEERTRAAGSLELLRQALFSATSCGWFFDDVAGIEARQVLRHAARACELASRVHGADLETRFVAALSSSPANAARAGTAADVFLDESKHARRTASDAAALHAIDRWCDRLDGQERLSPAGSARGGYLVEEAGIPEPDEMRARSRRAKPGAASGLSSQLIVRHCRTLERTEISASVRLAPGRRELAVWVDGALVVDPVAPVRSALVDATARLASARISQDIGPHLDFLGRLTKLAQGLALPPGLVELSRGAARMELGRLLREPPAEIAGASRALARALQRARNAGSDATLLADLSPRLNRALAFLTERAVSLRCDQALIALARAVRLAGSVVGDSALIASRRALTRQPIDHAGVRGLELARALRLEPSALRPSDMPLGRGSVRNGDGSAEA